MIPLWAQVWGLRILVVVGIAYLCSLADSGDPALAFALAWGPNGLFFVAFMKGALHLPRFLDSVRPVEPVLYRWVGVGLVKRIVTTRVWPMLVGMGPAPKPVNRREFLNLTELSTKGAELCHAGTFVLASAVAVLCMAAGRGSTALWIVVFNVALNGYPVMLQRFNRWRIHQLRTNVVRDCPPAI